MADLAADGHARRPKPPNQVERCLERLNAGDASAWPELLALVYDQLHQQARAVFRTERNTIQATALLHDALSELLERGCANVSFEEPSRFFAFVSRVIRNRLRDHARRRNSAKRGGGVAAAALAEHIPDRPAALDLATLVALHDVLEQLRGHDEGLWAVTELKFFCGLTTREIADALGRGVSTVESDWVFARAWLQTQLERAG